MTRTKMFISVVRSFVILHVVVGAALLVPFSQAQGNDSQPQGNNTMFPAEPAAASSIGWQGNYFVVRGRPTILWSGSMHYARIPRELWRERLVEAKRAGINTIQTYVFWNAHEPQSGVFDFSDNLDLDAWLKTIEEVGLYAVVRMGPYNGGEWLQGGTPQWITAQPGMQIRKLYPPYLSEMDVRDRGARRGAVSGFLVRRGLRTIRRVTRTSYREAEGSRRRKAQDLPAVHE